MSWLRKLFMPPRFDDEVTTQQALMLHVILWTLILVPIPIIIYGMLVPSQLPRPMVVASGISEIVNILLLVLLRNGYVRTASLLQVTGFWLFFTLTGMTGAGVRGESYLLGYGLVIVIAGILLGGTGATVFTILALATGAWMTYREVTGAVTVTFDSPLTTWVVSLVLFPVGAVLQYLGSRAIRDALRRARASEERYRLISRVTSDYTFSTELNAHGNMRLNWVAGAFEEITGYTFEEYIAKGGWKAHLHQEDRELDERGMDALRSNQQVTHDVRTFKKNGEVRWARVYGHPVWDAESNRLTGIVGAVKDITEQKEAEEALRRSEAIYRQAIEIAGAVPYHQTYYGRVVSYDFIGDGIEQITGYPAADFDEHLWDSLTVDRVLLDDLANYSWEDAVARVRIGAYPIWKCEHCIRARDGSIHWVFEAAVELRDEHGISHGSIGLFQDITEQKQTAEREARLNASLQEELRQKKMFIDELEAKNAELERFTYTVSHDLKSPLVTITGFLGYLEKDALAGNIDSVRASTGRISSAAKKMEELLSDLLELSRIGRLMNAPENIPFEEIVGEALERVRGNIEANQVQVVVQPNLPVIRGDKLRLVEIVQNLVDNAVKFTSGTPQPRIEIGTAGTDEQQHHILFVCDNGIGIAPQFHERIFGLFNKLNPQAEGTGIGLTLVKRIIEVHDGRIWVESEPGRGATFYFALPPERS